MALDQNYFDAINIDVVKKKYYNANKVNACLLYTSPSPRDTR